MPPFQLLRAGMIVKKMPPHESDDKTNDGGHNKSGAESSNIKKEMMSSDDEAEVAEEGAPGPSGSSGAVEIKKETLADLDLSSAERDGNDTDEVETITLPPSTPSSSERSVTVRTF